MLISVEIFCIRVKGLKYNAGMLNINWAEFVGQSLENRVDGLVSLDRS